MTQLRVRLRNSFMTLTIPDGWDTWTCQGLLFRRTAGDQIEYRAALEYLDGSIWRPVQVLEIAA